MLTDANGGTATVILADCFKWSYPCDWYSSYAKIRS
jgi:hypothetical protein